MAIITKIAPRREGQREDLYRIEERMHHILGQIAECDRILRQAREAEKRIADLRAQLVEVSGEYVNFLSDGEKGA